MRVTQKQRVAEMLATGLDHDQIAKRLGTSRSVIASRFREICRDLGEQAR